MEATLTAVSPVSPRQPQLDTPLSGAELVALQLMAQGYSPGQIACLRGAPLVDVLWDLQRVLTVLRATTVREAICEARHRGLIV